MEAPENCSVKVAVHVRPLINDERLQGCKDCITVTPGKPQVQLGAHSFTFDHVYGSGGSPSSAMFGECISPLVESLFQGYNATVLAYGQTGSGKTYTMGTGLKDISQIGLIPKVMNALFDRIEKLKHQTEFQLHVSFIEILKEEVRDLLDSDATTTSKLEIGNGHATKVTFSGRQSIQIRETSNGVITLAGSNEVAVSTLQEMTACLEQGSLSRATGSTNMNNQSSRSHAIFTITLEQMRKLNSNLSGNEILDEDMGEEYFCAKLHLVDLAGSERAKRTGSNGLRLKEGIHINKGLLALGNVISALGDEKKRKEGAHVPYRDSKLTRLLQDSLGGNSKTVMIACVSPADINAEESLNTLKYANRARNIQNKPVVNRDLVSNEMQKMRQQIKYLQDKLCVQGGTTPSDEVQVLKERIAWLEATNEDLCHKLHAYRSKCAAMKGSETDAQEGCISVLRNDRLKRGFQSMDSSDISVDETVSGESSEDVDEESKEWEHAVLKNNMDRELSELNKRLRQKEYEMQLCSSSDTESLKHHFGQKIMELEEEKRIVQQERDRLLAEVQSLAANFDGQIHKIPDIHTQKLKTLEAQISELKKKQENQVQLLKQKQKSDEAAKRLQAEIQYIKAQKVQLQHKMKHVAEEFRQWKASREKELLQLKKEGRKNEYQRHKLEALNQRQKQVLQRKTEEAATASKKLKELLEARKSGSNENSANFNGNTFTGQSNEKLMQRWIDHELEVMVKVHEVRLEHEKQSQLQASLAEELHVLKQVDRFPPRSCSPQKGDNDNYRVLSMPPDARMKRIASLELMLCMSSDALNVMASQLSEAEGKDRAVVNRGRWKHLRSMGDAKNLLQYIFNVAAEARCHLWERHMEIKDMKDQIKELVLLLQKSEIQRKEFVKELNLRECAVPVSLNASASGNLHSPQRFAADDVSGFSSPMSLPAPKQLKFTPGIANNSIMDSSPLIDHTRKMVPVGHLSMRKLTNVGQSGKLWRWKRSHHQWLLQFKWKWQKPWKLSEWIKHSDETIIKSKPRSQALTDMI